MDISGPFYLKLSIWSGSRTSIFHFINNNWSNAPLRCSQSISFRACLHQASVSTLRQLCYDTSDNVFIEYNGVVQKWVATLIWSDSIVFNENSIASIITELSYRPIHKVAGSLVTSCSLQNSKKILPVGTTLRHCSPIHCFTVFQEQYQSKSWNGQEPWGRQLCE